MRRAPVVVGQRVAAEVAGKVAPAGVLSMMMGVWLSTSFVGGFLAGYLGTFWSAMSKPGFFLMLAVISAAAGLFVALASRPLRGVLRD